MLKTFLSFGALIIFSGALHLSSNAATPLFVPFTDCTIYTQNAHGYITKYNRITHTYDPLSGVTVTATTQCSSPTVYLVQTDTTDSLGYYSIDIPFGYGYDSTILDPDLACHNFNPNYKIIQSFDSPDIEPYDFIASGIKDCIP